MQKLLYICAALVKFDGTVVVLDGTGNGNNITDLEILAALETEALDYSFAYFDIDCDILVIDRKSTRLNSSHPDC